MKTCSVCKITKPLEYFHKNKKAPDGRQYYCKQCRKTHYKEDRDMNRKRYYKNKYGIPIERYDEILKIQDGKCAICKTETPYKDNSWVTQAQRVTNRFAVDHCHSKGNVRGLLCFNCNIGIGKFEDNIEYLQAAIEYLKDDRDYR